ncbi:hypothetical protein VP01_5514g1 [Puccinia sorghi]|uniref:Uncharacterized protein n=1 Tax=Puccinia sorghi TaxID=27349 RepID=A0A0L6UK29_9BASI|nr:hypothetical protein VP01_5514g1 [Puccinia sorghi]
MAPPKSKESGSSSRGLSTRSRKPELVPPGDFDRQGLAPQLESSNGGDSTESSQVPPGVPRSKSGRQSGHNELVELPGGGDSQQSGMLDRERAPPVGNGGVESTRQETGEEQTQSEHPSGPTGQHTSPTRESASTERRSSPGERGPGTNEEKSVSQGG